MIRDDETVEILARIASGEAFPAEVENELEERGLIVQDHRPYAHLTPEGVALLTPSAPRGFARKNDSLYVHSHGNLVQRQQARTVRTSVWIPVVGGHPVLDYFDEPMEFHARADAERVVLDRIGASTPSTPAG